MIRMVQRKVLVGLSMLLALGLMAVGGARAHKITITPKPAEGGKIEITEPSSVDVNNVAKDTKLTITVTPNAEYTYKAKTLKVTGVNDVKLEPVTGKDNAYTFTMPDEDVTITAEFELIPTYKVNFTVTLDNGEKAEGAKVQLIQGKTVVASGVAGKDGKAVLEGVRKGKYKFVVKANRQYFNPAEGEVEVKDEDANVEIKLEESDFRIITFLVKNEQGDSLQKASVWVFHENKPVAGCPVETNKKGLAKIQVPKSREYTYTVHCSRYISVEKGGPFTADIDFQIEVTLEAGSMTPVESTLLAEVMVSPNPMTNVLYIRAAEHVTNYTLFNVTGAAVLSGVNAGSSVITLYTDSLPSGVYLLRLQAADGDHVVRLVK